MSPEEPAAERLEADPNGDPEIALVWAMSENRVIGRDGDLPWHLPKDLRRFQRLTRGRPVVMGRRTWDSLDGPLPKRRCVILSRDPDFTPEGVQVARTFDQAVTVAARPGPPVDGVEIDPETVMIAGGAGVYARALEVADVLYETLVHARVEGDTFFPSFDPEAWTVEKETSFEADERHDHPFRFRTYRRIPLP